MLSYLHASGLHETYDSLRRETDTDDFDPSDGKAKWVGLLEKKWTSVIRLQKKVCLVSRGQSADRKRGDKNGWMSRENGNEERSAGVKSMRTWEGGDEIKEFRREKADK
jgi:hypothetical protein